MNRAVEISVGSLSPTINWGTLKLEEFAIPPLDQQSRIAEILWAVDEVRCVWDKHEYNLTLLHKSRLQRYSDGRKISGHERRWRISLGLSVGSFHTARATYRSSTGLAPIRTDR